MRFDEAFLEEVKARLRPSEIIGQSVSLKRAGREWVGLSPFTKEKSPSFYVNDDKGFFHDFSSGKHGDIITFLQEKEGLDFPEAVEKLAALAGLSLPAPDPKQLNIARERQSLSHWLGLASQWFTSELQRHSGAKARAYLESRGFSEADWTSAGLGYAPPRRMALKDYLIAKGARVTDLVAAGLLIIPEGGEAPFDRFSDRIMFPITDIRGQIISFGGRALDPLARAKYLNGPQTSIFNKGDILYGLAAAKKRLYLSTRDEEAAENLVVVEGYMDVLACQRAGIAAVAPLGTGLTEVQMRLLWRFHQQPILCFDSDAAGQRAGLRAMEKALPLLTPERSFQFVTLTGGKDPDDILRKDGTKALLQQFKAAKPFVQVLFESVLQGQALDRPEARVGLQDKLLLLASKISDKALAKAYREDLMQRFSQYMAAISPGFSAQSGKFSKRPSRGPSSPSFGMGHGSSYGNTRKKKSNGFDEAYYPSLPTPEAQDAARRLKTSIMPFPAAVALFAIRHPLVLDPYLERLDQTGFGDSKLLHLAKTIAAYAIQHPDLDRQALRDHLIDQDLGSLIVDIEKAAAQTDSPFLDLADDAPEEALSLACRQWRQVFDVLIEKDAIEQAFAMAKKDVLRSEDVSHLHRLRTRGFFLERCLRDGSLYNET